MNQVESRGVVPADPWVSVVMPVSNERTTVETIIPSVLAAPHRIELVVTVDRSSLVEFRCAE